MRLVCKASHSHIYEVESIPSTSQAKGTFTIIRFELIGLGRMVCRYRWEKMVPEQTCLGFVLVPKKYRASFEYCSAGSMDNINNFFW